MAPPSELVEVKTWVAQAASLKRRKVTLPVGPEPPDTVAMSCTGAPKRLPGDAWVLRVGLALVMVADSLTILQCEIAGLLAVSPVYTAVQE